MSGKIVARQKDKKIHRMLERCRIHVPVSKGNRGNKTKKQPSRLIFQPLLQLFVVCIILNNSLVGIVTSLFLKNLNSIVKAFASALELVFTAIFRLT
jgi:hypothetical protein